MQKIILIIILQLLVAINCIAQKNSTATINKTMDSWHQAAATANFKDYFNAMSASSVFIGTDATERWNKTEFMAYAKPHFDKGKAWNFTSLQRFVSFSKDGKTAWIDELLDTQMKICRGSGVLIFEKGKWLIAQYVLSMTTPNDLTNKIVPMKTPEENKIIEKLKHQ